MKLHFEAVLSVSVTLTGAAVGFFGNLYLARQLAAVDYLSYGFAIAMGGLVVEGLYLWQKNATVALSGCGVDALDNVAAVRIIILIISTVALVGCVVVAVYSGKDFLFAVAIALAAVLDGIMSIQLGMLRATSKAIRSYAVTFLSTIVRWVVLAGMVPYVGFVLAFACTLLGRAVFVFWSHQHLNSARSISVADAREQRRRFWGLARGFVLFSLTYALLNHLDRVFLATSVGIPAEEAKELLFYSIFGSQVVGLFGTSFLTMFYPRLVSTKVDIDGFRKMLALSSSMTVSVGLAVSLAIFFGAPLVDGLGLFPFSIANSQSLLFFSLAQAFLIGTTIAQVPSIIFVRGRTLALLVYVVCVSIYVGASYYVALLGKYHLISVVKAAVTLLMFTVLITYAFSLLKTMRKEQRL